MPRPGSTFSMPEFLAATYTKDDVSMSGYEWLKTLNITQETLKRRFEEYGIDDPRFLMSKKEMFSNKVRTQVKLGITKKRFRAKLETEPVERTAGYLKDQYRCHVNLIATCISDAKDTVRKGFGKPSLSDNQMYYYRNCLSFLKNRNGQLKWFLEHTNTIDVDAALSACKEHALKYTRKDA